MTFTPVVPMSGLAGWRFLERTVASQTAAFERSAEIKREKDYFQKNIQKIATAEQLVSDRTLFKVALGAFGLDEEIGKKFFMRKVLEEGTEDSDAFANRLVDTRYRDFARSFGFGDSSGAQTALQGFAAQIVDQYDKRQFERAVGEVDNDIRIAMTFRREITTLANSANADTSAWFQVMGNPPLRRFFEKAYNLPVDIGSLDIDRQREIFREKTQQNFGDDSLATFRNPDSIEKVTRLYFARISAADGPNASTPGYAAISILASGSTSLANLLRART